MAAVGLLSSLPAPKREFAAPEPAAPSQPAPSSGGPRITTEAPPYGSAERRHYIPRRPSDFGDGGAFPEVWATCSEIPLASTASQAYSAAALSRVPSTTLKHAASSLHELRHLERSSPPCTCIDAAPVSALPHRCTCRSSRATWGARTRRRQRAARWRWRWAQAAAPATMLS